MKMEKKISLNSKYKHMKQFIYALLLISCCTFCTQPEQEENTIHVNFDHWIQKVGHNDHYVLAQLLWKRDKNYVNIIYDKSSGTSKYIPEFEEAILVSPRIVTDEYVLSWCSWKDLEQYVPLSLLDDASKIMYEQLLESEMENILYHFNRNNIQKERKHIIPKNIHYETSHEQIFLIHEHDYPGEFHVTNKNQIINT